MEKRKMTMEEMQARLEALEKENEELKEKQKPAYVKTAEAAEEGGNPNRLVKIKLFKDSNRYNQPLFVSVNDYTALIQRGVVVEVPYFVAKHIEEMNAQDENTAALMSGLESEYTEAERNHR